MMLNKAIKKKTTHNEGIAPFLRAKFISQNKDYDDENDANDV